MIEVGEGRPDHFHWIEERTGCVLTRNARALIATEDGLIQGMIAFDNWTPASVQMHMAVENGAAWEKLTPALHDFVFRYADKQILIGIVPSFNKKSLRRAVKLGGVEKYRIAGGWDGKADLVLFEMRRPHG